MGQNRKSAPGALGVIAAKPLNGDNRLIIKIVSAVKPILGRTFPVAATGAANELFAFFHCIY
jgi:hypothetical protein